MAYNADDYLFTFQGTVGDNETWSNSWAVIATSGGADLDAWTEAFRQYYLALSEPWMSTAWHSITGVRRNPFTAVSVELDWATIDGVNTNHLMPTQCAIRTSLRDALGHNGGPFICGWCEDANAADGLVGSGAVTVLVSAVQTLQGDLQDADGTLALNRTSVPETTTITQARIGERWDVIRKRANDTLEAYTLASL